MQITITIDDNALAKLAQERIDELLGDDARYRQTGPRDMLRRIVDEAAIEAVTKARAEIAEQLPTLAREAVRYAITDEIGKAAKRGVRALSKLYAGFDPSKITPEQKAWLEGQIAKAASIGEQEDGR